MPDWSARLNTLANYAWGMAPGCRTALGGRTVHLVAHRGAHFPGRVAENTLAAFERCLNLGVWGVEMDIRLTRDKEPVVHHDPHCGRLFGREDLEIASVDFKHLRAGSPDIPHLSEVLERYGGKMHLMLEIKESPQQRPALADRVSEALARFEPEQDYHLLSLVPEYLESFTDIPRSALVDVAWFNVREIVERNLALGHGGVSGSFALLTNRQIRRLRAAGKKIGTGFVETSGALRREVYREVDWIFTDCIEKVQAEITGNQMSAAKP